MKTPLPLKLFITGLVAGCGGGLLSLGGGTLLIPLLMGWGGFVPLEARGLAIATSLITAATGSWIYYQGQHMDFSVALWVAIPSVLITPLAAAWSEH
ncbi:MAG: TSUP family transporter [Thiotrichales bacterium]